MKFDRIIGSFVAMGIALALAAPAGAAAQAVPPTSGGPVVIQSQLGGSLVADIKGGSTKAKAVARVWTANGAEAQSFRVTNCDASGACEVRNVKSNLCLDIRGGKSAKGTMVWQYKCTATEWQQWKPVDLGDGTYGLQSMVADDRWLEVQGGKAKKGAQLQINSWTGAAGQRFTFAEAPNWDLAYAQVAQKTTVTGTFGNVGSLSGKATKVTITATMKYKSTTTRTVKLTRELGAGASFTFDLGEYGPWKISTVFYNGSKKVRTNSTVSLGVVADEYVVAPLTATMPVTMLTTSMWGPNSIRGTGDAVPVIAQLNRAKHWNWDKLPANVHALPYLTKAQYTKQVSGKSMNANLAPFTAYIKDLYALNKNAVFHLYIDDYYARWVQQLLYANKIPEANYTITMLSDGTFSYSKFAKAYAKDPAAAHAKYAKQWADAKAYAYKNGKVNSKFTTGMAQDAIYAAIDSEPNAQWWLTRPALLTSPGDDNATAARAIANPKVVTVGINNNLIAIKNTGAQALSEFKGLFQFDDAYFAKSKASGKDVMMFLGTTLDTESNFVEYAKFTMKYYGSAYDYYYKGHPRTPTGMSAAKVKQLSGLKITDVDSSVPAELILFFNPDIYMSGYPSSTYSSVSDPDMAKGLFTMTKANALKSSSPDYSIIGWFMSPKSAHSGALAALPGDFVVEFADKVVAQKGYDVATWTTKTSKITYYKLVNGAYTVVAG